jgi:hypothetical protein
MRNSAHLLNNERKGGNSVDKEAFLVMACGSPLTPEEIILIKEGDEDLLEACLQQDRTGMPEEE